MLETQALVSVTLDERRAAKMNETLWGRENVPFMLHYNFPPYSVGEVRPLRGPGRREIGHGHLARRALLPALLMLGLVMASFSSIGILSAGMVIYFKRGDPVTWLLASGSTLLGGIFFPVSILPEGAQMLARLLPITHAVEGFRELIVKGATLADIWPNLQYLLLFAAIFLPLGIGLFYLALRRARMEGTLIQY